MRLFFVDKHKHFVIIWKEKIMKNHISYDVFRGLYVATLLDVEFSNVYGQGKTPELAKISLTIRYNQLKSFIEKKK
jgi:hypothetical protein